MHNDYQLHLTFLPVQGEFPQFSVYRRERGDNEKQHPEGCWGYTLPISAADPEARQSYWVSFAPKDGLEPFSTLANFNNELSKQAILEGLFSACKQKLAADKFWCPLNGFIKELHLNLRSHPEGNEQLILQPYFLRAKGIFGLLVDFHFRMNEGVPFSRRIQQLSLSLDRNGRRNVDFYLDRSQKIVTFLEESTELLKNLLIPGTETSLRMSRDFVPLPAERLRSRVFILGGNRESRSQFAGLRDFGPLTTLTAPPNLVFVFREMDRQASRELATALRGDNPRTRSNFPGFEKLFKTHINIDRDPVVLKDFSTDEMKRALALIEGKQGNPIPIMVMPQDEMAYLNHKAIFTHGGIPSQVCTLEVIQDDYSLKWSVGNIALQIFCKAGGLPWKVRPTHEKSLIIGISQSHKVSDRDGKTAVEKYFAFTVLTDSSGLFQKIQVLSEAESEQPYLEQLAINLKSVLSEASEEFARVVIHTSFKLRHREMDTIQAVVRGAVGATNRCRFAVVKVNQVNRFFAFNRDANSLVPYEGSYVRLGRNEYLVWCEGIFPDKQTVNKVFPGPTHLQFLKVSDEALIEDQVLLQDLINLSGANWRGFNAKSAPVSVFYCHLVADLVHDFQSHNLPLPAVQDLRPWFL